MRTLKLPYVRPEMRSSSHLWHLSGAAHLTANQNWSDVRSPVQLPCATTYRDSGAFYAVASTIAWRYRRLQGKDVSRVTSLQSMRLQLVSVSATCVTTALSTVVSCSHQHVLVFRRYIVKPKGSIEKPDQLALFLASTGTPPQGLTTFQL